MKFLLRLASLSTLIGTLFPFAAMATNTHYATFTAASSQSLSIVDASQTGLDVSPDVTLEAWVNISTVPTNGGAWYTIAGKYYNITNNRQYLLVYYQDGGVKYIRLIVSADGSATKAYDFVQDLGTSTWKHVAVVFTGAIHKAELFIDGTSVSNDTTGAVTSLYNGSGPFAIGAWNIGSAQDFMNGKIDDVRVWNTARSSSDISTNYNCELTGSETGLKGYWKLNNNANDSTSNANNLTNNNSVTYSGTSLPFTIDCAGGGGSSSTTSTATIVTSDLLEIWVTKYRSAATWIAAGLLSLAFFATLFKVFRSIGAWRN